MRGLTTVPPLYGSAPTQNLSTSTDHTQEVEAQALKEPQDMLHAASGLGTSPQIPNPQSFTPQSIHPQFTNTIALSTSHDNSLSPITELQRLLRAENASDVEHDHQLFHAVLKSGISARSDAEMLRILGVSPEEAPEALKALRRAEALSRERDASAGQGGAEAGGSVEREFIESGIDALTRLSSAAVQKAGDGGGDVPWDLPPWTITRCVLFS